MGPPVPWRTRGIGARRYLVLRSARAWRCQINARWLLDRDGRLTITIPETVEASADELAPALAAA